MVTVDSLLLAVPSLTVYVNESEPAYPEFGVYVT